MKKVKILSALAVLAFLLLPSIALAQRASLIIASDGTRFCKLGDRQHNGRVLNAVPLNGAASTRTFTFGQEACGVWVAS